MAIVGGTAGLSGGAFPPGTTIAQAATQFDAAVHRKAAYAMQKIYLVEGNIPATVGQNAGISFLNNQGAAMLLSAKPSRTLSPAQRTAFQNLLTALDNAGFGPQNCWITLWQECNIVGAFATGAAYLNYVNYYWTAAAQSHGFPLVFDPLVGGSQSAAHILSYYQAGLFQVIAVDYYGTAWRNGLTIDFLQQQANTDGIPFALAEWGECGKPSETPLTQSDWNNNYVPYLISVLNGATHGAAFALYYNAVSPTDPNQIVPVNTTSYSKVPGFQKLYDAVTAPPVTSATFTRVQRGATVTGSAGTAGLWFSQSGGAASTAGTLLVARIQSNDGAMTITPPAGWTAGPNVASGAATSGVARSTVFYRLANPGSLYGTSGAAANFTYSNTSAQVQGHLEEFSTPAGTVQHYDATPAATGSGATAATSFPLTGGGAVTASGGLGVADFALTYSAQVPAGNSFGGPSGWTYDRLSGTPATFPYATYFNNNIAAGTPSLTATFSTSVNQTGWAASAAFFYALTAAPTVTTATLPNATLTVAYSQALAETGGTGPFTWAVTSGSLPPGLSLSSSGTISGTPTTGGTYPFTVTVTDSTSATGTRTLSIAAAAALSVTTASLPGATTGAPYSQALAATGGFPAYTWKITAGALPAGLGLNSATGTITGTPSLAGTFSFTATVTDTAGSKASQALSITVTTGSLAILTTKLAPGTLGKPYTAAFTATGGVPPYTWALTSGSLPPGLALASDGTVTGTLRATGDYPFTVTVTDSA